MHLYIRVYGIRLPSVCARISPECGIRSQPVRLPVQCSAVTSAGYELALGGSQTCNIWLPKWHPLKITWSCLLFYEIAIARSLSLWILDDFDRNAKNYVAAISCSTVTSGIDYCLGYHLQTHLAKQRISYCIFNIVAHLRLSLSWRYTL